MTTSNDDTAQDIARSSSRLAELAQQANNPEGQDWYSSGSVIWLSRLPYGELPSEVNDHFGSGFTPFLVAAAKDCIILKPIPAGNAPQAVDLNEEDIATLLAETV